MGVEPDGLSCVLYLDDADSIAAVAPALRRWHDLAVEHLLPLLEPLGAPRPAASVGGMTEDPAGVQRPVKAAVWADGIGEDLLRLRSSWIAGPYQLSVYAFRFTGPRHLQLAIAITFPEGAQASVSPAAFEVVRRLGDTVDFAYGEVTVNRHAPSPSTRLDLVMRRPNPISAAASRTTLRGYEWVTVLPSQLAERLGGAGALRDSGAFAGVTRLGAGSVMVRATATPDGFPAAAGERVTEVLRPVLPEGTPRPLPGMDLAPYA